MSNTVCALGPVSKFSAWSFTVTLNLIMICMGEEITLVVVDRPSTQWQRGKQHVVVIQIFHIVRGLLRVLNSHFCSFEAPGPVAVMITIMFCVN